MLPGLSLFIAACTHASTEWGFEGISDDYMCLADVAITDLDLPHKIRHISRSEDFKVATLAAKESSR